MKDIIKIKMFQTSPSTARLNVAIRQMANRGTRHSLVE